MLDEDFLRIKSELEKLNGMIEHSLDNYKREGFENNRVYEYLERKSEYIDDISKEIKYFSCETIQGNLTLRTGERYEIPGTEYYFTSGSRIEVLLDNKWCIGRVECRHDDRPIYYFLNDDGENVDLYEGMTVRTRRR